jgi:RNA recognition motif-containing protein
MDIQVSNISLNIIDSDIRKLFSVFGVINSVEVNRNRFTGRSKGNAFVNMPIDAEAKQAIVSLDKTMMDGKKISVNEFNASPQW